MTIRSPWKLALSIFICEMVGIIGASFTFSAILTWFSTLNKPIFNPPSSIFGPVWGILYLLMAISLYIVWDKNLKSKKNSQRKIGLWLFAIQLFLNAIWSLIFFGAHAVLLAFIDILLLWVFILATIITFWKLSKYAANLLIPYLLWVSFAVILNYSIYILNR